MTVKRKANSTKKHSNKEREGDSEGKREREREIDREVCDRDSSNFGN